MRSVRVASRLNATQPQVWEEISTFEGINDEFAPWLRMSMPRDAPSPPVIQTGRLGRSWLLLFGVLPIDYDDLVLEEVTPGVGFRERSVLGSAREWHHDRTLQALPDGRCAVIDDVAFTPRLPFLGGLQAFLVEATFRWRHRRLRRRHP